MQGTFDDIVALQDNLAKIPATLAAVRDPNKKTPGEETLNANDPNSVNEWEHLWVRQHPSNGSGEIRVKVEGRRGPDSDWLDPVDTAGSGLLKFIESEAGN